MPAKSTLAILCCVLLLGFARAEETPPGVQFLDYKGWPGSVLLSAKEQSVQLVVVPAVGGRVLHYGPSDANIIFENDSTNGKTLANTKGGFWVGGYQCDIGPEIFEPVNHPALWMGQYKAKSVAPNSATVTSEPDSATGIQLEKEFAFDPRTGSVAIKQHMKNISGKETKFCVWDRTLCKGGGFAFFPLNKKSRFGAGWALRMKRYGADAYNTTAEISAPNVRILDGVLVAECAGKDGKLGADSDAGWIAYARGRQLYIKAFPYFADGKYTDGGNSVELYWSDRVAELEPLSPEIALKPGEQYTFPETWLLLALPEEIKTFEQARALAGKVEEAVAKLKDPR